MLTSAIDQFREKEMKRLDEERMENEFKKRLMEKFAEDERLEQYNALRRKQRELDLKKEVNTQKKYSYSFISFKFFFFFKIENRF